MARGLSFRDAVRMLGGTDSKIIAALEKMTGGAMLTAAAGGADFLLGLFGPKAELARLTNTLMIELKDRVTGLSRFDRTNRLVAAHAVLVLSAYFDVLLKLPLPKECSDLRLGRADQIRLALGDKKGARRVRDLLVAVIDEELPMPTPHWPYEQTLGAVHHYFEKLASLTRAFLTGLAGWDLLNETQQRQLATNLWNLPSEAINRYEQYFRRIAGEFPEFAFWANLTDHQATRAAVHDLRIGLAEVERALTAMTSAESAAHPLKSAYRNVLDRPVLTARDVPAGLQIPKLGEAYITPKFRVVEVTASDPIAAEKWWLEQKIRTDLPAFLVRYLTAPHATEAPLLVLGQPGAGKSVLTQVLAARLTSSDYLVVRVVLREVRAESDLQSHIEQAVRSATGEETSWPALARNAGTALPVVMLDGFDELLQATGVSQSDYLERVADFQRREASLGRPLVVIVTSRTAVADRARPAAGMIAVRLEPFSKDQIARWLKVWNTVNQHYFSLHGIVPLTAEAVAAHRDLACQPLLLMMLALYDADENSLQKHDVALGQAELYEALLIRFAGREVAKSGSALSADEFAHAIEQQLLRLSVAAFAMFNRTRQWVTEAELDADLGVLLAAHTQQLAGLRAQLTAAQLLFGRFFFVHETQALQDDQQLRTYEFLHATFGEYLVARLISVELGEMVAGADVHRSRPNQVDDSFLHALLSFAPLTMRETAISFVSERLNGMNETRLYVLRELLVSLLQHAFLPRRTDNYGDYRPDQITQPGLHANYSANLVILILLASRRLDVDEIFPCVPDPVDQWRRLTQFWRSQLPDTGWKELIHVFTVERAWKNGRRTAQIVPLEPSNAWEPDTYWIYDTQRLTEDLVPPDVSKWRGWSGGTYGYLRNQSRFQCVPDDDVIIHALDPFHPQLNSAIFTFHVVANWKKPVSAAQALFTLWLATAKPDNTELTAAFDVCLQIASHGFAPPHTDQRHQYRTLVLHQLALHHSRLPREWLIDTLRRLTNTASNEIHQKDTRMSKLLKDGGLDEIARQLMSE
ncbi:hypothetical protein SD37_23045 [Amycolatopsis orientalis]|uniref:NACHT N-terminal Helical domain-containing protein n=1 Tax=Amycolatopsis orientalis TaxID=31958 RepID=A0A193C177_AMYOR|nr:NACHT domain-containing protein [Amycolatopsis orientalis]ANN18232.1 hypothetical protein SD37_23045 [Amycolatopsis orientalis]